MRKEDVTYDVISHIGRLTDDETAIYSKEINSVSWNNRPAMIEVRTWKNEEGIKVPLKGLTFTQAELIKLRDVLNTMKFGADSDRDYEPKVTKVMEGVI